MGYLSCRAESSISTCRSLSAVAIRNHHPSPSHEAEGATATGRSKNRHRIHRFTYRQMEEATSNFSEDSLLGRGSHGSVYKAHLSSSRLVAVKRPSRIRNRHTPVRLVLPPPTPGGGSFSSTTTTSGSRNEVENEIDVLSRIHGPRLVNLVGFTTEPDDHKAIHNPIASSSSSSTFSGSFRKERLLVIEYMPNGTLYDLLHSSPRPPGWARRLRLALQTAKAIHSLHSHHPPVIHRDVKSANVLLDDGHNARLGDFGLAVVCDENASSAANALGSATPLSSPCFKSTPPAGTLGYLDPGYVTPENLSTKTDVFSFGILLLEIMSGRKAIDVAHSPPSIVEWAVPLIRKGKVLALYDQRIAPPRDPVARRQLAALAASCVRSSRDRRPSMDEVVDRLKVLSKTVPSKAWNGLTVGNPCSVVEIERTRAKHSSINNSDCTSSPRGSMEIADEMPLSVKNALTRMPPGRTSMNGRRVFFDSGSSGRNLMELLKAPNEETIRAIFGNAAVRRQESGISRAKVLHLRENVLQLQRNISLRDGLEALSLVDKEEDSNGRVCAQAPPQFLP